MLGYRLRGRAGLALSGDDWLLQQVRLQLGATHLEADGRFGKRPDVHFALDVPDLSLLSERAHGRLKATGYLGGEPHAPVLQAKLTGAELAYEGVQLHELSADVDLDGRANGRADATVQLGGVQYGRRIVDQVRWTTVGTTAAHHFSLRLSASPYTVQAGGTASLADGRWRAEISDVAASDGAAMQLTRLAPANLVATLDGDELQLERLCLHDAQSMLCAASTQQP